eukprot:403331725
MFNDMLDQSIEDLVCSFNAAQERQSLQGVVSINANTGISPKSSFQQSSLARDLISNMDTQTRDKLMEHFKNSVGDQAKMAQLAQQMLVEMMSINSDNDHQEVDNITRNQRESPLKLQVTRQYQKQQQKDQANYTLASLIQNKQSTKTDSTDDQHPYKYPSRDIQLQNQEHFKGFQQKQHVNQHNDSQIVNIANDISSITVTPVKVGNQNKKQIQQQQQQNHNENYNQSDFDTSSYTSLNGTVFRQNKQFMIQPVCESDQFENLSSIKKTKCIKLTLNTNKQQQHIDFTYEEDKYQELTYGIVCDALKRFLFEEEQLKNLYQILQKDSGDESIKQVLNMLLQQNPSYSKNTTLIKESRTQNASEMDKSGISQKSQITWESQFHILEDQRFNLFSIPLQKLQSQLASQIQVCLHYIILNKLELFGNYSKNSNVLSKYKDIMNNIIQTFLVLAELYMSHEEVIKFSTNNVYYINLRRKLSQRIQMNKYSHSYRLSMAQSLKQAIEMNGLNMKKLLRQSIIKSVSYTQLMLDVLSNNEDWPLDLIIKKLLIEKDRYMKKYPDIFIPRKIEVKSQNTSRCTTPRSNSKSSRPQTLKNSFSNGNLIQQQSKNTTQLQSTTSNSIINNQNDRRTSRYTNNDTPQKIAQDHLGQRSNSRSKNTVQNYIMTAKKTLSQISSSTNKNYNITSKFESIKPVKQFQQVLKNRNHSPIQEGQNSNNTMNLAPPHDSDNLRRFVNQNSQKIIKDKDATIIATFQVVNSPSIINSKSNSNLYAQQSIQLSQSKQPLGSKRQSYGSINMSPKRHQSPHRDLHKSQTQKSLINHQGETTPTPVYKVNMNSQNYNQSSIQHKRLMPTSSMKSLHSDPKIKLKTTSNLNKFQKHTGLKESQNRNLNNYNSITNRTNINLQAGFQVNNAKQKYSLKNDKSLTQNLQIQNSSSSKQQMLNGTNQFLVEQDTSQISDNMHTPYTKKNSIRSYESHSNKTTKKTGDKSHKVRQLNLKQDSKQTERTLFTQTSSSVISPSMIQADCAMFDILINKNNKKNSTQNSGNLSSAQLRDKIEKEYLNQIQQQLNFSDPKNKPIVSQNAQKRPQTSQHQIQSKNLEDLPSHQKITQNFAFNIHSADSSFDEYYHSLRSQNIQNQNDSQTVKLDRPSQQNSQFEEFDSSTDKQTDRLENLDEDYIIENEDNYQIQLDQNYQRAQNINDIPQEPFLPQIKEGKEYTLVLDLDETLIHYDIDETENEGFYLIRPGALRFLYEMQQYYEIVVFTAAIPEYADWIIDSIDPEKCITHRLYRQHTTAYKDYAQKDINKLGRPMSKIIIVDNLEENFKDTSYFNGLKVKTWIDEMDDKVLELLGPFLKQIVQRNVEDVRILFKNFKHIVENSLTEGTTIPQFSQLDLIQL